MNPVFKTNADSAATLILDGDEYPVGEILIRNENFDFEGWTYESTIDNRDYSKVYSIKSADQKGYAMKYIKGSEASVEEITKSKYNNRPARFISRLRSSPLLLSKWEVSLLWKSSE